MLYERVPGDPDTLPIFFAITQMRGHFVIMAYFYTSPILARTIASTVQISGMITDSTNTKIYDCL